LQQHFGFALAPAAHFGVGSSVSMIPWHPLFAKMQTTLAGADSAHDFLHVQRVVHSARALAHAEGANVEIAAAAALLHEIVNLPKNHPDSSRSGDLAAQAASELLTSMGCAAAIAHAIAEAIADHAFSKGVTPRSLEGRILQDADRLDAIGAIGIARCMATCASMGRPFYDPEDPFAARRPADDKLWGIDHFPKKLLRIAANLHTESARRLAERRAGFMERFLDELAQDIGVAR
jgi:uncharacterized protein